MPYLKNNRGQGLVEYVLIVVLMAILAITVVKGLGSATRDGFSKAKSKLQTEFNGI